MNDLDNKYTEYMLSCSVQETVQPMKYVCYSFPRARFKKKVILNIRFVSYTTTFKANSISRGQSGQNRARKTYSNDIEHAPTSLVFLEDNVKTTIKKTHNIQRTHSYFRTEKIVYI